MNTINLKNTGLLIQTNILPTEKECRLIFKEYREKMGVKCKKCSQKRHYFIASRMQWHCKNCGFRTTLRSGTALENSKLSFQKWFQAINILSQDVNGVSAKQLQLLIGLKRYQPAWSMLHKIRRSFIPHFKNNFHDESSKEVCHIVTESRCGIVGISESKDRILWRNLRYWNEKPAPYTFSKLLMPVNYWGCSIMMKTVKHSLNHAVTLFWQTIRKIHKWVSDKYLQNYLQIFRYFLSHQKTEEQYREMILTRLMAYY
ncbi:MAG: transposase [Bacteroidetes bacterium]|nr:transposase [Bacteroidota bacterium]